MDLSEILDLLKNCEGEEDILKNEDLNPLLNLESFEPLSPLKRSRSNTWHGKMGFELKDLKLENLDSESLMSDSPRSINNGHNCVSRKSISRRNAWGSLSYADMITQAINSTPEKRMTLSEIYAWMVQNIPFFRDKGDSNSSAGWKNSIRHNLSLHSCFMRVQNEGTGKSSWWMINPDYKASKPQRRRAATMDTTKTNIFNQKRMKVNKRETNKLHNNCFAEMSLEEEREEKKPGSGRVVFKSCSSSCKLNCLDGSIKQEDMEEEEEEEEAEIGILGNFRSRSSSMASKHKTLSPTFEIEGVEEMVGKNEEGEKEKFNRFLGVNHLSIGQRSTSENFQPILKKNENQMMSNNNTNMSHFISIPFSLSNSSFKSGSMPSSYNFPDNTNSNIRGNENLLLSGGRIMRNHDGSPSNPQTLLHHLNNNNKIFISTINNDNNNCHDSSNNNPVLREYLSKDDPLSSSPSLSPYSSFSPSSSTQTSFSQSSLSGGSHIINNKKQKSWSSQQQDFANLIELLNDSEDYNPSLVNQIQPSSQQQQQQHHQPQPLILPTQQPSMLQHLLTTGHRGPRSSFINYHNSHHPHNHSHPHHQHHFTSFEKNFNFHLPSQQKNVMTPQDQHLQQTLPQHLCVSPQQQQQNVYILTPDNIQQNPQQQQKFPNQFQPKPILSFQNYNFSNQKQIFKQNNNVNQIIVKTDNNNNFMNQPNFHPQQLHHLPHQEPPQEKPLESLDNLFNPNNDLPSDLDFALLDTDPQEPLDSNIESILNHERKFSQDLDLEIDLFSHSSNAQQII